MKPNWKDAPQWANWLAMDGDGYWWWFESEPEWAEEQDQWSPIEGRATGVGSGPDYSGIDWDFAYDTLESTPEVPCEPGDDLTIVVLPRDGND